jgi:hypothetical protein
LDPLKSSIGVRIQEKQNVTKRFTIDGKELAWTRNDSFQRGATLAPVPTGAALYCIACYAGQGQHYWWVADPKTAQNPFRVIHEVFDTKLTVLQELIAKAQVRGGGGNARDLEMAVEWLLWMLGFSPTHIGGPSRMSEAPDLIVATPQGNILVVECTTGLLKEINKLPHLVERTEQIRKGLLISGNQYLRVLPVLATTKTRDEVRADLEQAHRLGILVVTKEDILKLIDRTIVFPDANKLYTEAEEALRRLQAPAQEELRY